MIPDRVNQVDLTVQQIRTFFLVFELGSYSQAAREVKLSTSAIWEHVRGLERTYETKLFEKQGRQVVPTQAGHRLEAMLRPLLANLDSTREVMRQASGVLPRRITIVGGVRMFIEEVTSALHQFQQEYPEIVLEIIQGDGSIAEKMVIHGEADLAMSLEPGPGFTSGMLQIEPAYEIDFLLVTPSRHALIRKKSLRLADLVDYPLVLPCQKAYSRHLIDQAFHRQGLLDQMNIAVETTTSAFTAACVRAKLGIGIMAGQADGPLCKGLNSLNLSRWFGQARVVFMWKRGASVSPVVRKLADTIRNFALQ